MSGVSEHPTETVADLLSKVTSCLPGGGAQRPGQRAMAEAVAKAITQSRHLVVQAGTGTGKSLAYLLPLAQSGAKAVVATATKALQDQLAQKDLPFLACELRPERDLTYAVLKGRSNYFCRQRAAEDVNLELAIELDAEDGVMTGSPAASEADVTDQIRRIVSWAEQSISGDRADLDFEPHPRAWAAVSVGAHECPGAFRCPSGPVCFAERARALAAAADVVVVNTHLYATHVASGGTVLPEHDVLVFDEAHAVEDIMTAGLGVELSAGRLRAVAVVTRGLLGRHRDALAEAVIEVAQQLEEVLRESIGRRVLRREGPDDAGPDDAGPDDAGPDRSSRVSEDAELERVLALAGSRLDALGSALRKIPEGEDDTARRARALLGLGHLLDDLHAIQTAGSDHVAWVEQQGGSASAVTLRLAPIEVGTHLAQRLWPDVTGVLTSATVPPLVEGTLGLPRADTDRLDVGSPFPFSDCALLYCPTDLPDRRQPGSDAAVQEELLRIITAAGGRTLALFTSWRAMRNAVDALRGRLDLTLLAQNDLPKPRLIAAFRDEESACLFATMSFWQGVDVPGTTLSVVTIDRLPFPRPDDPLLQARREHAGEGAFRRVDLPRAATLLAQGAGRLIRSETDRGMVGVLDRRLATAGYGATLRAALPPMRFTTRRKDAMAFLGSIPPAPSTLRR